MTIAPIAVKRILLLLAGLWCLATAAARLPGLYDNLWEDEVHYNYVAFHASSLKHLRAETDWMMRPVLDYAARKYIWFSNIGFKISERNLALVAWIYALTSLIICLIIPWTSFVSIQWLSVIILGLCGLEAQYSTEAQGYSFVSLASFIVILNYMWGSNCLLKSENLKGMLLFTLGFGICINAHFFSWPLGLMLAAAFLVELKNKKSKVYSIKLEHLFAALIVLIIVASAVLSKSPLLHILRTPPSSVHGHGFKFSQPIKFLAQAWQWLGIACWFYIPVAVAGFFNPIASRRRLAFALATVIFPIKYLFILYVFHKSSYPLFDRYLIMYIAPSIILLLLGFESILLATSKWRQEATHFIAGVAVLGFLFYFHAQMLDRVRDASIGIHAWSSMPINFSRKFAFFESIKQKNAPVLVLTNHCWASDIPKLYINYIGSPTKHPIAVLNTMSHCETSPAELDQTTRQFLREHLSDGLIVVFNEFSHEGYSPCKDGLVPSAMTSLGPCVAIYSAKTVDASLIHYVATF